MASGAELRAVLRAGFPARQVVFTGPGKTDAELVAAMRAGIGALTIESLDELDAVIALAPAEASTQGLLLRLASSGGAEGRPIIGAPGSAKFGLTDDEAREAVARLHGSASLVPDGPLRLRGFHAFGASNVRDAAVLVAGVADLARRAEAIAAGHGLAIELLDAGGGLGIPYAEGEEPLDLAALGRGLRTELSTWLEREPLRGARLLLEPGRWLTGPAGAYVCRVIRTKEREGRWIAVTDGGIHHLLRPRLVDQDQRVVAVGAAAARPADARIDVVGPLCTGLDYLASGRPRLRGRGPATSWPCSMPEPTASANRCPSSSRIPSRRRSSSMRGAVTVSRERIEPV